MANSAATGFTQRNATQISSSRKLSLMMLATLLSTPVNAQVVEPVIAYWNSAFEKLLASSSEPSSRCSAMMLALRLSMRAMNLDSTRMSVIARARLEDEDEEHEQHEQQQGRSSPVWAVRCRPP